MLLRGRRVCVASRAVERICTAGCGRGCWVSVAELVVASAAALFLRGGAFEVGDFGGCGGHFGAGGEDVEVVEEEVHLCFEPEDVGSGGGGGVVFGLGLE